MVQNPCASTCIVVAAQGLGLSSDWHDYVAMVILVVIVALGIILVRVFHRRSAGKVEPFSTDTAYAVQSLSTDQEQNKKELNMETLESKQTVLATDEKTRPLETGEWFGYIFLCLIPFVNIIALIVWSASSQGNINRRNWARAYLGITAIIFVLVFLVIVIGAAAHS